MDINLTQAEAEHLKAILTKISNEIQEKGGWIPFSRYMELALYQPSLGYYTSALEKFGRSGDFITASEISPFFGQTIVNTILPVLEGLRKQGQLTRVIEIGAGTGQLAKMILLDLHRRGFDLDEYHIIDVSPNLIERQQALLLDTCQNHGIQTRCQWHSEVLRFVHGVILANEVFDAIPCERIVYQDHAWHYAGVGLGTKPDQFLISVPGEKLGVQPLIDCASDGYTTEIHPQAEASFRQLIHRLEQGLLLMIDYGFHHQEYYHPQRNTGTLMAHFRHQALTNVLALPGISDITCHINFSNLLHSIEHDENAQLFFSSQASFLLDAGITDLVLQQSDPRDPQQMIAISNGIQKLISEAEMGELFKVLAFGKNLEDLDLDLYALPGFGGRNRVY
jgi:SAM-dependent MidA family methyltransferase